MTLGFCPGIRRIRVLATIGVQFLVCGCGFQPGEMNRAPALPAAATTTQLRVHQRSLIAMDLDNLQPIESSGVNVVRFTDVATASGIEFVYQNGAAGESLMVESIGGGGGWIDFDRDGVPDLYLVQGGNPTTPPDSRQPSDRLYRNLGARGFRDVSSSAGVVEFRYGQGIAVGDLDNDGFDDIVVTNVGQNTLFENMGDGTVQESAALLQPDHWNTSAAWADLDRDGDLDLYMCRYTKYDPRNPHRCFRQTGEPGICHPKDVEPEADEFFLNRGDGTFEPCAQRRGLAGPNNRALGVAIADFDNDDWPDVFVANDTTDNFLFINRHNGEFDEMARLLGCAVNSNGSAQANMGVAVGDYDGNGLLDVYITHYTAEWNTLYQNLGPQGFHDVTASAGLSVPTIDFLGFGTVMQDFDRNGYPELLVANGHVDDLRPVGGQYEMKPQLFGYAGKDWKDLGASAGEFFQRRTLGRAIAVCDFDSDGDFDAAFVNQNSPTALLQNDSPAGHWLKMGFVSATSNRHGIGTRLTVRCGDRNWMQELAGGTSYCAANEPVLIFGFGECAGPYQIDVRWPDGMTQTLTNIAPDQSMVLQQPVHASGAP